MERDRYEGLGCAEAGARARRRLKRLQAIADSTDGQRFADALDAQKIEQAARTGDTELLRQILTQVLSTDAGQRLAGKVKDAMQDG